MSEHEVKILIQLSTEEEAFLEIYSESSNEDSLLQIEEAEASGYGESPYQLLEGHSYEYYITSKRYKLQDISRVVKSSRKNKNSGRITPNIYVGTLTIDVVDVLTDEKVSNIYLEIRSVKTRYRENYRYMLEDITEKCTDLLMQSNSPVYQNFSSDFERDSKTDYQRFAFVQSLLSTEEFNEAVSRIVASPVTQWKEAVENADIRGVRRIRNYGLRQIATNTNRTKLNSNHPLYLKGIHSLPERIHSSKKIENVDTAENRFIKYALEEFRRFCSDIYLKAEGRVKKEAYILVNKLDTFLNYNIFKNISRPNLLKLNSPVLHRKEGYREILRAWIMYDLAAKLIWEGGDDVYKAGKRDVATLYEYWLFFTLLDLFKDIFNIESKSISDLIKPTKDGLGLQLKQGKHIALDGVYDSGSRKLKVNFSYNRSFKGGKDYPDAGSMTKTMRPDYTLAIWPSEVKMKDAEKEELIVYLHFDAKYRIENFFYNVGDYLDSEKEEECEGEYKSADLLKMHAYKDAIRRTAGAYVLYPGHKLLDRRGFRELIPGLGAFPIRPSRNNNGISYLKNFIEEVIKHFVNRNSQREHMSYRVYDIYKDKTVDEVDELMPEPYGENRGLIPSETNVLVGYYKSPEHLEWCEKRGLYNFRMGSGNGSLIFSKEVVSAKFLLLHTKGDNDSCELWKIIGQGPKVYSKDNLLKKEYPSTPSQDHYVVYKVEKSNIKEFNGAKWKFKELNGYKSGYHASSPFAVTLAELMKVKKTRD